MRVAADVQLRSDAESNPDVMLDIIQARAIWWGDVEGCQASRWLSTSQGTGGTTVNAGKSQPAPAAASLCQGTATQPVVCIYYETTEQRTIETSRQNTVHLHKRWRCGGVGHAREVFLGPVAWSGGRATPVGWRVYMCVKYGLWIRAYPTGSQAAFSARRVSASMGEQFNG